MRQSLESHGEEIFLAEKMTFSELADRYTEIELVEATFEGGVKVAGRRSVSGVKSAIKALKSELGNYRIQLIRPLDIKAYKSRRLTTPVEVEVNEKVVTIDEVTGRKRTRIRKRIKTRPRKVASVKREMATLRAILNFAVSNDWLDQNPFTKLKGIVSISAETQRDRILSIEEEERLLAACTGQQAHIRSIVICALDTAMRKGEIFKMKWNDVRLDSGEIFIPLTNTKTDAARTVGMTARLKDELLRLWKQSSQDPEPLVFGIVSSIKRSWTSVCKRAQPEDFRFHDCRHTATTRMVASGSPHTEVMKITGHSQMKTFLRYLNITSETTNRVASKLDNYLTESASQSKEISDAVN